MLMGKLVIILQSWLPLPFTFKTLTFISTNTIYLSANIDKKGGSPVEWGTVANLALKWAWYVTSLISNCLVSLCLRVEDCQQSHTCWSRGHGSGAGVVFAVSGVRQSAVCGEV